MSPAFCSPQATTESFRDDDPQPAQTSTPQSRRSSVFSSTISPGSYQSSVSVGIVEPPPFRRSLAPTPKPKTATENLQGSYSEYRLVTPQPQFRRSAAPSLSDYAGTLRAQSHDVQTSVHHGEGVTSEESSRGTTAGMADLVNEIDDQIPDDHKAAESSKCFPTGVRSPTWSLLTASPVTRLPTVDEVNDDNGNDIIRDPVPSSPVNSTATPTFQKVLTFGAEPQKDNQDDNTTSTPLPRRTRNARKTRGSDSRPEVRGGRTGSRRGRRAKPPARWSPILPWTSAEKAAFHGELQQRIAAITSGTGIDSGLLDVPCDYFDM
ncbi:uncharacterized protein CCOS01_06066 [Colletotrichum costaricense]|uniref:Uncharacterized protein n=1 Tax=Colletotrichum costaricense TaxID=1209916 RepID=A0AAI9Z1P1_9PEZI|nr:uncharacterized protein CCOS01_06066 [Colletotrichum costaricense]KAK1530963.1 hypothetical protein CCOS01_06066 [Colletotrichum costaricense]